MMLSPNGPGKRPGKRVTTWTFTGGTYGCRVGCSIRARLGQYLKQVGQYGHEDIETFLNCLGAAREVDDQCAATDADDLTRGHRHRGFGYRLGPHLFCHAGHEAVNHINGGLRRHITRANAGASGRDYQRDFAAICPVAELSGDYGAIIGSDGFFGNGPAGCDYEFPYQFSASVCSIAGSPGITGNKDGNTNISHLSSVARHRPGLQGACGAVHDREIGLRASGGWSHRGLDRSDQARS